MKTVKCALVMMYLFLTVFFISGQAVATGHNASVIPVLFEHGFATDNNEGTYLYDWVLLAELTPCTDTQDTDDDAYTEDPEDDPDMEPAPEPDSYESYGADDDDDDDPEPLDEE